MILLEIDGLPVPWKAHAGYGRRSFNPRFREKEFYQWQIKAQFNQIPIPGPISIDVTFHLPIPSGTSKVRKTQMLNGKIHHLKRPDLDNLNKFLCDCLKGIVMEDDSQVFELTSRKIFSEKPRSVIKVNSV